MSLYLHRLAIILGASLCSTYGSSWSANQYPHPHASAEMCRSGQFGKLKLQPRQICDPDGLLGQDQNSLKRVVAAFEAFEQQLFGTAWDIDVGLAVLGSSEDPLTVFAASLASSWNFSGEDQALLVLSTDARAENNKASGQAGSVVAGGLLDSLGQPSWRAALEQRMAALLRNGQVADAVEAGLSGLLELLGGNGFNSNTKSKTLEERKTKFQALDVQTNTCGQARCNQMFLDDILQLTDRFEAFYHESMVIPALNALGPSDARRVLVLGGGDGGIASLALQFDSVERVVLVDIDEAVTAASKKFFLTVPAGLGDKRCTVLHGDALKWVRENQHEEFDLVILDFSDTPIAGFWTEDFFVNVKGLLAPRGAFVQNIGTALKGLQELLSFHTKVFKSTWPMGTFAPDYYSSYILAMSSDALSPFEVDWQFWERQRITTNYYTPSLHRHLFSVGVDVMRILGAEPTIQPVCPASLPRKVKTNGPREVSELAVVEDEGVQLFKASPTIGGLVTAHEYDMSDTPDFVAWGRERVPCRSGSDTRCFRGLRLGFGHGAKERDLIGPIADTWNEIMVLPALNILGRRARRVLVLGGGDGVMANLILKFGHVEQLVVVDINEKLVEAIHSWFPRQAAALQSSRTRMVIQDAFQFLDGLEEQFDAIFVNLAHDLFKKPSPTSRVPLSSKFVRHLRGLLTPEGVLVQDIGSLAAPRLALRRFTTHKSVFEHSWPMAFATLKDTHSTSEDRQMRHAPRLLVLSSRSPLDPVNVDWSVWQDAGITSNFYHASMHDALFVVPAELQRLLQAPPLSSHLVCGAEPPKPALLSGSTNATQAKLPVLSFRLEAQACIMSAVQFIDHISRFVSFPSYGSWLHKLNEATVLALTLLDGASVSVQVSKGSQKASVTLVCQQELCGNLRDGLRNAVDKGFGCTGSLWVPVSPVTWQAAEDRTEL